MYMHTCRDQSQIGHHLGNWLLFERNRLLSTNGICSYSFLSLFTYIEWPILYTIYFATVHINSISFSRKYCMLFSLQCNCIFYIYLLSSLLTPYKSYSYHFTDLVLFSSNNLNSQSYKHEHKYLECKWMVLKI